LEEIEVERQGLRRSTYDRRVSVAIAIEGALQVYLLLQSQSKSGLLVLCGCRFDCVVRVDLNVDEGGCGKRVQVGDADGV
jgi:hypothetical protein